MNRPSRLRAGVVPGIAAALILCASTTTAGPSTTPAAPDAFPSAELVSPDVDLGELVAGERAACVFSVKNTGKKNLLIEPLESCCCVQVSISATVLEPGHTAAVTAVLDSARSEGPSSCLVTLKTNDPERPYIPCVCRASVTPAYELLPPAPLSFEVFSGEPWEGELWVRPEAPSGPPLVSAWSEGDPVDCMLEAPRRPDRQGEDDEGNDRPWQRLEVRFAGRAEPGEIFARVVAQPEDPRLPCLTIPIHGTVKPDVAVDPPRVLLGMVRFEGGPDTVRRVTVTRLRGAMLKPEKILSAPGYLRIDIEEGETGDRFDLVLTLIAKPPKGPFYTEVDVQMASPHGMVIRVPVSGIVN